MWVITSSNPHSTHCVHYISSTGVSSAMDAGRTRRLTPQRLILCLHKAAKPSGHHSRTIQGKPTNHPHPQHHHHSYSIHSGVQLVIQKRTSQRCVCVGGGGGGDTCYHGVIPQMNVLPYMDNSYFTLPWEENH